MPICGMDIATKSGIAIFEGEKLLHAEAFRPKGDTDDEIFHGFRVWLRPLVVSFGVTHAAIEEPLRSDLKRKDGETGELKSMTSMSTLLRLYGLRAHAIEMFFGLNIPCYEANQSEWRSAFLRDGKKGFDDWKKAALAQCQLMRWPVPNADAAEACGVAWWLSGQLRLHSMTMPGDLFYGASPTTPMDGDEDEHAGKRH